MDLFKDNNLSLKLFVELLSEERYGTRSSPRDWDEMARNLGDRIYREILQLLTQTDFEPEEAREHWFKILEHREQLHKTLGRDPGVQVTVCDYFTNIHPALKDLVMVDVHSLLQKERSALVDDLTGLFNRRYFNKVLNKELETARRFDHHFSLLIIDIDKFKVYNDTFGHPAGDVVLKEMADKLLETARTIDHIARYGGDEFVVILPRAAKEQALMAAERYHRAIEEHAFAGQDSMPSGNLTVTIGVATYPTDAEDGVELISRADDALYQGKKSRKKVAAGRREHRTHPRYPMIRDMALRIIKEAEVHVYSGQSRDISLGGAKCHVIQPVDVGQPLDVVIAAREDESEVNLAARVVHLTKNMEKEGSFFLGLQFDHVSREQENSIKAILPQTPIRLQ